MSLHTLYRHRGDVESFDAGSLSDLDGRSLTGCLWQAMMDSNEPAGIAKASCHSIRGHLGDKTTCRRHAHGSPGRSTPAVGLSPAGEAQVEMAVGRLLVVREEEQLELLAAVLALFGSRPCPSPLHKHTT